MVRGLCFAIALSLRAVTRRRARARAPLSLPRRARGGEEVTLQAEDQWIQKLDLEKFGNDAWMVNIPGNLTASSPLKMGIPKRNRIIFQPSIFRGYVIKFRGCIFKGSLIGTYWVD